MKKELKNVFKIQINYKSGIQIEIFCLIFTINDGEWNWKCCNDPYDLDNLAYQVEKDGLSKESYIKILEKSLKNPIKMGVDDIESVIQLGSYIDVPFIKFD